MTSQKAMSPESDSKVVCVTGASSGIGLAAAEVFAEHGATLIIGARRVDRLETISKRLKKLGAKDILVLGLDVRIPSSVEQFVQSTLKRFNALDVLVNSAGLAAGRDPLVSANIDDWERMIDTNVKGLLRVTKSFLPTMIEQKRGHIINIGSIAGYEPYEGGSVYSASKFGVRAITKTLRLELSGTNIRVTIIDPGMVNTEFSLVRLGDQEKADAVYKGMMPLIGRDVAECIYFAASRPPHVNVDQIFVMPTDQASATKVFRR